jgi:hydrogenase-4 component F
MEFFASLSAFPILGAAMAAGSSRIDQLRRLIIVVIWLHAIVAAILCAPVLTGSASLVRFTPDFAIDRIGASFLMLTNFVAACSLSHSPTFFRNESLFAGKNVPPQHERLFYASALLFVLAMNFVFVSDNLGLLWVSIEATTLFSAGLVYFSRDKHALEATWKYLMVCSVGIAFALLGTILIFAASQHGAVPGGSLNVRQLLGCAKQLEPKLLELGYIFCLLGYGTKAGIFPLHTWLPDAHSEAPAPASAMLSGALLNCALFAIWRVTELVRLTEHHAICETVPMFWGALTALAAGLFLVHQNGIKRLWAYSSIENVGIMLVAIGLGSPLLFFLQALNHSVAKVALFLLSGNIIQYYKTKDLSQIRGLLQVSPTCGILFAICAAAVTGMPPFGAFIAEWLILAKSADAMQGKAVAVLLIALAISFVAVSIHVSKILWGVPKHEVVQIATFSKYLIPSLLCLCTIVLGLTALPLIMVKPI